MSDVEMGAEQPEMLADDASVETDSSPVEVDADAETSAESEQDQEKRTPWFTKRIDKVTAEKWEERRGRERAEAERDQLRELLLQQQTQQRSAPQPAIASAEQPPTIDQFESWEEFNAAQSRFVARQVLAEERAAQQQRQEQEHYETLRQSWWDKVEQASAKYADFSDVARVVPIPAGSPLERLVLQLEDGPDVLYAAGRALAENPQERERISRLPPEQAAFAIGRLAASATAPQQPRRVNQPSPPINTPLAGGTAATTDPARMTDAQFAAWRRAQIAQRR
jgi:hypothetical protein